MWSSYQHFDQAQESSQWKWNSESSLMSNLGNIEGPVHLKTVVALDQWEMVMDGVIIPEMEVSLSITDFRTGKVPWHAMIYLLLIAKKSHSSGHFPWKTIINHAGPALYQAPTRRGLHVSFDANQIVNHLEGGWKIPDPHRRSISVSRGGLYLYRWLVIYY